MGYSSGILVVDGFQWGRLAGIMRFVWYLMLGAIVFAAPENDSFRTDCKGILTGVFAGGILLFLLFLLFRKKQHPDTYQDAVIVSANILNRYFSFIHFYFSFNHY